MRRARFEHAPGRRWNLQDAKARLSELVDRARLGEPQVILRRGEPAAVILAYEQYARERSPRQSILSFFQESPLVDLEFEIPRSEEPMRDVDL
jgi:antitoxin Phd